MDEWNDTYNAGVQLAEAAEKILERRFGGDRSRYVEALSLASQQAGGAVDVYAGRTNLPWAPDDDTRAPRPQAGARLAGLAEKVLKEKYSGDRSRYAEALSEASRTMRPELLADYQGQVSDPTYTRLMDATLAAKATDNTGVFPLGNNPKPPAYAPRGLLDTKVIDAQAVTRLQRLLQRAGPVTYGDLQRALVGPAPVEVTAPGITFAK